MLTSQIVAVVVNIVEVSAEGLEAKGDQCDMDLPAGGDSFLLPGSPSWRAL